MSFITIIGGGIAIWKIFRDNWKASLEVVEPAASTFASLEDCLAVPRNRFLEMAENTSHLYK